MTFLSDRTIELGHLIAVCFVVHTWTIKHYGHPESLVHAPHGLGISILLSGFVAPVVQASLSPSDNPTVPFSPLTLVSRRISLTGCG